MQHIQAALERVIQNVFNQNVSPVLTRPDEQFGDYATNVALQLAGKVGKPPREVAELIVDALKAESTQDIKEVTIAGPGFINITLSDEALIESASKAPNTKPDSYEGKVVVAEYSDPNPFKVLHAGHFYTSVIGYSIASLVEAAGAVVHRVNFGGDVGLHAGKTMWAIVKSLGGEHPQKLADIAPAKRSDWMAECYVTGTNAYEDDPDAAKAIKDLNKRIYQLFELGDHDSPFAQIYWTCRAWSYEYFDAFYARIGTPFEKYYPESECAPIGLATVKEQLAQGVYERSDNAVVFRGEPFGLHTRVFINAEGLPTYEAKDVGLIMRKYQDYKFDTSLVITGNEQEQYMAVVLKSIEQFAPELANATKHMTHGLVKMRGGVKMSSRKGNILRATDVINAATAASKAATGRDDEQTVIDAIKYSFLKNRIGADLSFDPQESVSMEGNSGPYLQYAHARARSILAKAVSGKPPADLTDGERSLARKISEYPDTVQKAVGDLMPHHICTYLYELAQVFNRFYEHNHVIGEKREAERAYLIARYADVLQDGLGLLNIAAPERL